jgi:hypothetical protein
MGTRSKMYKLIDYIFYSMEGTTKVEVESAFATEDHPSLMICPTNNIRHYGVLRPPQRLNKNATAVRQSSNERGERKIMLSSKVLFHNFRVSKVGQN